MCLSETEAPDEWRARLTSRLEAELWRDRLTDSGVFNGDTKAESLLALLFVSVMIDVGVSIKIFKLGNTGSIRRQFRSIRINRLTWWPELCLE